MSKITITFEPHEPEAALDYKGPVWNDINGHRVAVKDLNDLHLLNIARTLDRRVCEVREMTMFYFDPVFGPRGDMARDCAEAEMMQAWDHALDCKEWLNLINAEIARRGLVAPERLVPKPPPKYERVESLPYGTIFKLVKEEINE